MKTNPIQFTKKNLTWLIPTTVAALTAIAVSSCSKQGSEQGPRTLSESQITAQVNQAKANKAAAARIISTASVSKLDPAILDQAKADDTKADAQLKDAAEKFARMGELLLQPEGVEYADEMFSKALDADANNGKANFYKAVTEPSTLAKGFIPRVERLLITEKDNEGLERLRRHVTNLKLPEVEKFANVLPANEKPFTSYYDVQRYAREKMLPSIQTALARLDKIDVSNAPLTLYFYFDNFMEKLNLRSEERSYRYEYHWCDNSGGQTTCVDDVYNWDSNKASRTVFNVDKHDLKAIRASYLALVDSIRIATAYSLKDSEFVIRRLKAVSAIRREDGGMTAEDVTNVLREFPDLLTLEHDQQFTEVGKNLAEAFKNGIELNSLQEQICENPDRIKKNPMFMHLCVTFSQAKAFQMGVDLLAGPKQIRLGYDAAGNAVYVVIDVTRVLKTPIKDIKALLPTSFDDEGTPTAYADPTMGGLFPNGDLIEKFRQLGEGERELTRRGVKNFGHIVSKYAKDHL